MDNEREVNAIVERSKMIFLKEIIEEFKQKQQQYDPAVEFAKTKKNKSVFVPLTIALLLVVFGGVVVWVTGYIQRSSHNIAVNIEDFADVNLRDLLDGAKRLQTELEEVLRQRGQLVNERDLKIKNAEEVRDRSISLSREAAISEGERQNQIQTAEDRAQEEITTIRAEYDPQIAELEARIAELQDKIAEYDSRQLEQAREQEEVLDNQQRVYDLQIEELKQSYEEEIAGLKGTYEDQIAELEAYQEDFEETVRIRHQQEMAAQKLLYNPRMDREEIARLFAAMDGGRGIPEPGSFDRILASEGILSEEDFAKLGAITDELKELFDRLDEIPYENSVPEVLSQMRQRIAVLLDEYEMIRSDLQEVVHDRDTEIGRRNDTIQNLNTEIDRYNFALKQLSEAGGNSGYVLDTRDSTAIQVFINPLLTVDSGTIGYVFRADDEYIGTIRFYAADGRLRAELVELAPEQVLQPYDKVLIEVQ